MPLGDVRLTDPTEADILRVLRSMHYAMSLGVRVGSLIPEPRGLAPLVAKVLGTAEGVEFVSDTPGAQGTEHRLVVAWWLSPLGKRHVRVTRYHPTERSADQLRQTRLRASWPPLWHIYPDRVYRRHQRGVTETVCVCGCGATGGLQTLAWTGTRCGPCDDYEQEHGTPPPSPPVLLAPGINQTSVAVSADGARVAVAGFQSLGTWRIGPETVPEWSHALPGNAAHNGTAFAGLSQRLGVLVAPPTGLVLIDFADRGGVPQSAVPDATAFAFDPTGRYVAYVAGGCLMLADVDDLANPDELGHGFFGRRSRCRPTGSESPC